MRDYGELVKALREADSLSMCGECGYKGDKKACFLQRPQMPLRNYKSA